MLWFKLTHTVVNGFTSGTCGVSSGRARLTAGHLFILLECAIRTIFTRTDAIVGRVFSCSADACKANTNTLVFSSFKISNMFCVKHPVPDGLHSRVLYKFACAGSNACYVGETTRHFSTRAGEHLVSDRASHIFKHLQNSEHCRALFSLDCFQF